ncbi:MAG TPA: PDZ domain-containing protein, partial [Pyrinomonadaceae bacterium]|nr:PDZ domain-containing protein [Pyrinomonadaceae bacterium]
AAAPQATTAPPAVAAQAPEAPEAPEAFGFATTFFAEGNFLGVRTEEITRENMSRYGLSGEPRGVGVREVVKGSPAEAAGLRENDVIIRFDGEAVTSVRKLTRLIEEAAPEHSARLTVLRGGSEQELSATLRRREPNANARFGDLVTVYPEVLRDFNLEDRFKNSETWKRNEEKMRKQFEDMSRKHPGWFSLGSSRRIGVTTSALGRQLADYFGVAHGVLVSSVEENSPAEKAGLKAGDVITEADGQQVSDADDLVRALGAKEGEVTLTVVRDKQRRTVRVTPERMQLPGGGVFAPGAFGIVGSPVATVTMPRVVINPVPGLVEPIVVGPGVMATPRARVRTPRVRTPRVRVFDPDDRIL